MKKEEYDELLNQLYTKVFKNLNYTVYNFIENDGYIKEISACNNNEYYMDSFEFIVFDIPVEDRNEIKEGNAAVIQKYKDFKHIIENEKQKVPNCAIFIMKELGIVIAVKLKFFNIHMMLEA